MKFIYKGFLDDMDSLFLQINVYWMISLNCLPGIMFLKNVLSKKNL